MPKTFYQKPVDQKKAHSYTRNSPHITDAQAKAQTQKQPICNNAQTMGTPKQSKISRLAAPTVETASQPTHEHTRQTTTTRADFETRNHHQPSSVRSSKKPSLWQRFAWLFYPFQCLFSYANHVRMRISLLTLGMLLAAHATIRRFWDALYYAMHRLPLYRHIQKQLSGKIMQRIRLVLLQTLLHVSILFDHSITLVMILFMTGSKYANHMLRCMLYPLHRLAAHRTLLMFLIPNVRIFCLFLQITITLFAINSVRNTHAHTWHVSLYRYYKAHGFWLSMIDFMSKIAHSAWIFAVISSAGTSVPTAIFGTCMIYGYARWLFTQKEVYVSLSASTPEQAKRIPLHESTPRVNLPVGYFLLKKQLLEENPPQKSGSVQKKLALYGLCQDFERHVSATYKHRYGNDLPKDDISLFLPICYAIQRNETNQSDTPLHDDFYELQRLAQSTEQDNHKKQPGKTKSSTSKNTTLLVNHSLNRKVSKLMHELWPIWHSKNAHVLHQLGIKRMKYPRAQDVIRHALRII